MNWLHSSRRAQDLRLDAGWSWSNSAILIRLVFSGSHPSLGIVLESFIVVVAQKRRMIGSLVERASTTQDIVQRIFGKCLHGCTSASLPISVRIACIKWSIMMEYCLPLIINRKENENGTYIRFHIYL